MPLLLLGRLSNLFRYVILSLALIFINMQLILFIHLVGTQRTKSFFSVFCVYHLFKFHQSCAQVRKAGSDTDFGFNHTKLNPQVREADFVLPN